MPERPLYALTVRQPWASAIAGWKGRPGPKRVVDVFGKSRLPADARWCAIHAAFTINPDLAAQRVDELRALWPEIPDDWRRDFPRGRILALAEVLYQGSIHHAPPWVADARCIAGPTVVAFGRVLTLPNPVVYMGQPVGLEVPWAIAARVREQARPLWRAYIEGGEAVDAR